MAAIVQAQEKEDKAVAQTRRYLQSGPRKKFRQLFRQLDEVCQTLLTLPPCEFIKIRSVVLILGTHVRTAKEMYRMNLLSLADAPPGTNTHAHIQSCQRKAMRQVMTEGQEFLHLPTKATNIYVLFLGAKIQLPHDVPCFIPDQTLRLPQWKSRQIDVEFQLTSSVPSEERETDDTPCVWYRPAAFMKGIASLYS